MKKRFFLFGALAALAMGGAFTACSDDAIDEGNNKVAEVDQTRYLHVTIANPPSNGSRAESGNFETGTALENYVHELYFVFYDAEGVPTGTPVSFTYENNNGGEFNPAGDATSPDGNNGNVGKVWQSVIGVDLQQGQNLPSFVNAFVNPVNWSELANKTLTELDEETRLFGRLTDGHFPMSNAVYYADNPITGASMVRMAATPILAGQLYTTVDDAKANPALEIFVERYAAKVKLTLDDADIADNTTSVNGYKLKFVPEYWRINAVDKTSYVVKRYGILDDSGNPNYKPSYSDMNMNMASTWWNDPTNHRSYWAASPAYYLNAYPRVSDNVTDDNVAADIRPADGYATYYFTYDEVRNSELRDENRELQPSIKYEDGFSGAFYARETTTASRAWGYPTSVSEKYNPLASLPSVVIVGHYEVTKDGETSPLDLTDGFWLFGKTGGKWNLFESELAVKTEMSRLQSVVLKNISTDADNPVYSSVSIGNTDASLAVDENIFTIEHPSEKIRTLAGKTIAGRLVALQLDATHIAGSNLYWYTGAGYELITADNIDKVNVALLTAGYATQYGATIYTTNKGGGAIPSVSGLAYFSIPIEHLGMYASVDGSNNGTPVTGAKNEDGTYDFSKCPAGSFGIVRNHVYNINVTGISGLATALRDDTQPIVPPVDEVSYYVSAKLNILNWRIVPTQNVQL